MKGGLASMQWLVAGARAMSMQKRRYLNPPTESTETGSSA